MGMRHIRNRKCVPYLESEGTFGKLMDAPRGVPCGKGLKPFERMHAHHTLASARRFAPFKLHRGLIPTDELDFALDASYDHSKESFPDIVDVYMQPETLDEETWRRLRNTKTLEPDREAKDYLRKLIADENRRIEVPYRYNFAHPVHISGILEKHHPSHVKLMTSSHHLPQTNAGYSRQDSDGNVFQY